MTDAAVAPDAADDADLPVAATIVVVRDGDAGIEVLMMLRPDRGSFAGAWVFPGGKLEDADADGVTETGNAREEAIARRAGMREAFEETGLIVSGEAMQTFARWTPPAQARPRIRTWFFVAPAPEEGALVLPPDEVVAAEWVRPEDMVRRHAADEVVLYPPTWVTLQMVAEASDVAGLAALTRLRGRSDFETRLRRQPDGLLFLWEGDAEYDPDAPTSGRHRLDTSVSPWSYERRD